MALARAVEAPASPAGGHAAAPGVGPGGARGAMRLALAVPAAGHADCEHYMALEVMPEQAIKVGAGARASRRAGGRTRARAHTHARVRVLAPGRAPGRRWPRFAGVPITVSAATLQSPGPPERAPRPPRSDGRRPSLP
jgi:hypothetical protein